MKRARVLGLVSCVVVSSVGCVAAQEKSTSSADHLDQGPPAFECVSPLGTEVVKHIWATDERAGTVPRSLLYTSKNAVRGPFVDAKQIFSAMAGLIESARYEADLETYEWGAMTFNLDRAVLARDAGIMIANPDGPVPESVVDPTALLLGGIVRLEDRLHAEAAAGTVAALPVKVHIAIDGPHRNSPAKSSLGRPAVQKARALHKQLSALGIDPAFVEVHVGPWERVAGSLHSKLLVVDGYRSIVTGANPQATQLLGWSWHDTGYGVIGDGGRAMQAAFDDTWSALKEARSCSLDNFDPDAQTGFTCDLVATSLVHHPAVASPEIDTDAEVAGSCVPVVAATRREIGWATIDPRDVTTPQDRAFIGLLSGAGGIVRMQTPNLNAPLAKDALIEALGRGVNVRLILSLGFNDGSERAGLSIGGQTLIDAGGSNEDTLRDIYSRIGPDRCQRLEVRFYSREGSRPAFRQEGGWATHTKYLSVDNQLVMVGSANQDNASWVVARESNFVIDSATTTQAFDAAVFDSDWRLSIPVKRWAQQVLDGTVTKEGGAPLPPEELATLLAGDPTGWARTILDACP